MLSLKQRVGLVVLATVVPGTGIGIWVASDGEAPAEKQAVSQLLSRPVEISQRKGPGTVITPKPAKPVIDNAAIEEAADEAVQEALADALAELPLGKSEEELAATNPELADWHRGLANPYGGIPMMLGFSGGGLNSATATVPTGFGDVLRKRWGGGRRPTAEVTMYFHPKARLRADFFNTPEGQAPRDNLRVGPVTPLEDLFSDDRPGVGLASLMPLVGRDIRDVAKVYANLLVVEDRSAHLTLPPSEFSMEGTLATLELGQNGTVERIVIDLVEDVQPGLAQQTRTLLTKRWGQPRTATDEYDVVVSVYPSSPEIRTLELGGGERVRVELSAPEKQVPRAMVAAARLR